MCTTSDIKVILFDISGVLVELGGMPDFVKWSGKSPEDVGKCWLESNSTREFESGIIEFTEFHSRFCEEWKVEISENLLKTSFESWVTTTIPGSFELLKQLNKNFSLSCLTNTNPIQWPVIQKTLDPNSHFEHQFVSYLLGCVKPDTEIYTKVLNILDVPAERVLFFDDNSLNVASANKIGMQAYLATGIESMRKVLTERECI